MITLRVGVDFASFRKPFSREYRATEPLPPPSTCYGFLLSLVGIKREQINQHVGVRIMPALLEKPCKSTILRKFRRFKTPDISHASNSIPDFQEVLSNLDILMFVDSSEEKGSIKLEDLVVKAIRDPSSVNRFGALCLGESESIVNSVDLVDYDPSWKPKAFVVRSGGLMSLSAWPDYGACFTTRWAQGSLEEISGLPSLAQMAVVAPGNQAS